MKISITYKCLVAILIIGAAALWTIEAGGAARGAMAEVTAVGVTEMHSCGAIDQTQPFFKVRQ
jgi:hypothetical protein